MVKGENVEEHERRLHHLRIAIENLHSAGMQDLAEELKKKAMHMHHAVDQHHNPHHHDDGRHNRNQNLELMHIIEDLKNNCTSFEMKSIICENADKQENRLLNPNFLAISALESFRPLTSRSGRGLTPDEIHQEFGPWAGNPLSSPAISRVHNVVA